MLQIEKNTISFTNLKKNSPSFSNMLVTFFIERYIHIYLFLIFFYFLYKYIRDNKSYKDT